MGAVLHIIPATPPEFNGLGDYARMLHRHWPEPRPEWHVAALGITEGAEKAWPGVQFHAFGPNADSLAKTLRASGCETVALHYVPHGYQPKGIPGWLPGGLKQWKKASEGRLVTFFHELFAFGPPWRTAFWLTPTSIYILRDIVRLSEIALTSNDLYARQLEVYGGLQGSATVIPIGTNIAATELGRPAESGLWRIAVFGTGGTRTKALQAHRPLLRLLQSQGRITALVLVGSNGDGTDAAIAGEFGAVERIEDATEAEISRALASCGLGLVATDEARLFKSGVFAAYCAQGVVPIVVGSLANGPYIPASPRHAQESLRILSDPNELVALRSRVRAHAAASDWNVIAADWKRAMRLLG